MQRFIGLIALLPCLCPAGLAGQAPSGPPPDLDRYVESTMRDFEVPGLALTIVKDGRVVVARGYGVRTLGRPEPVDAHTRFGIASNTKAFTATAIGLLVEEGKLRWDEPVITYLPWFRLSDPYVTREITVRDLLVHRSGLGLGEGDLLWWPPSTYDRPEIARRLRFLPLRTSFRSAYAYDNVLYLIAGEVIEAVSGQSWEDFVASRILTPLDMSESNVRHSAAVSSGNIATPHARVDGVVRPVKPFDSDNTNPAGGINTSATDIAKWLLVQLDSGAVRGGTRLFSPATTRQLWTLVTPIPIGRPPAELSPLAPAFRGYALGFEVREYRGHKLVCHTGGLPGYVSRVAMIPDLNLGVAVLTNSETPAMEAIAFRILDHYLGARWDWRAGWRTVTARGDSMVRAAETRTAASRDSTIGPSLPLDRYAGRYQDPWYGEITVERAGDHLVIRFSHTPSLVGDLEHWQYDTFVARWRDRELRADAFVSFSLTPEGGIDRVKLKPVSPATDFSFDFQDLELRPADRGQ
ncbi:MAG TPA: serine hydrolase [Gemmatimonadales bacterium]|nr:serine hydrolase [Gemmatimonadales bacterium]